MDLLIRARFDVSGCSEPGSLDLVEIIGAAAVPRKGELIHIHQDHSAFYVDEIMHDFTEGTVIVRSERDFRRCTGNCWRAYDNRGRRLRLEGSGWWRNGR